MYEFMTLCMTLIVLVVIGEIVIQKYEKDYKSTDSFISEFFVRVNMGMLGVYMMIFNWKTAGAMALLFTVWGISNA